MMSHWAVLGWLEAFLPKLVLPPPAVCGQTGQHSPGGVTGSAHSSTSWHCILSQRMAPLSQTQIWQGAGFQMSLFKYIWPFWVQAISSPYPSRMRRKRCRGWGRRLVIFWSFGIWKILKKVNHPVGPAILGWALTYWGVKHGWTQSGRLQTKRRALHSETIAICTSS